MPFLRRGRRRPPFRSSRWQQRILPELRLQLAPQVRTAMTAWMKIYGETNDLPGLATGPIEVRFRRLREHAGADTFLLWTTPERWAAGEALSLWIPAIGLDMDCRFDHGGLAVERARPTTDEDRDPRRVRSAVGIELRPERVDLPPADQEVDANVSSHLEAAFERLAGRRWSGFVGPLREALEAEAKDDAQRAERLATQYAAATPRIGGQSESDPYRLAGVDSAACAAFDEGEWLDLLDSRGRVIGSARLVRADPAAGVLDVDVRGADPPSSGMVRPRPQTQILAQKRAILDELDNPTGSLQYAVRLVASPASLPIPARRRPATFINRLIARNRSQVRAVSLAVGLGEGQALMIQGPPGTGKSTTLGEIIGQIVLQDPNATILVCSHSNHGVDNLLLKTLPYLDSVSNLQIARVGLFDRVHPEARTHFVPPGEDLGAYNVVFTTVDALALQAEAGARTYDYAVLDEANRASILDSLIPLVRGRRFILVGDHLQLQPVLSDAEEQLRLEPAVARASAIGKSLFAWLRERRFPEAATVFLDEQNRMHPVIAGLISEVFYEGRLRSGPRAPRRAANMPLFPSPVTWVDTHGLHGLREARGRGASLMNVPEARLVATIARHVMSAPMRDGTAPMDVGVIAAYAEQTALLRRLFRQSGVGGWGLETGGRQRFPNLQPPASNPSLEVDTVDAFEGREKDIIIVSLVRSNRRRDIGFLRLMQRINVALSRARRLLIIVGDLATLRGSYFDRISRYIRANGMVVPGPRLIGRLLNARSPDREPLRAPVPGVRRRLGRGGLGAGDGQRRSGADTGVGGPRPSPFTRRARPEPPPAGAAPDIPNERRGRRRRRRGRRSPEEMAPRGPLGPQPIQRAPLLGDDRDAQLDVSSAGNGTGLPPDRDHSPSPDVDVAAVTPNLVAPRPDSSARPEPSLLRTDVEDGVPGPTVSGSAAEPESEAPRGVVDVPVDAPPTRRTPARTAARPPRRAAPDVATPEAASLLAEPQPTLVVEPEAEAVAPPARKTRTTRTRRPVADAPTVDGDSTPTPRPEAVPDAAPAAPPESTPRPRARRRTSASATSEASSGAAPPGESAATPPARPRRTRKAGATVQEPDETSSS